MKHLYDVPLSEVCSKVQKKGYADVGEMKECGRTTIFLGRSNVARF